MPHRSEPLTAPSSGPNRGETAMVFRRGELLCGASSGSGDAAARSEGCSGGTDGSGFEGRLNPGTDTGSLMTLHLESRCSKKLVGHRARKERKRGVSLALAWPLGPFIHRPVASHHEGCARLAVLYRASACRLSLHTGLLLWTLASCSCCALCAVDRLVWSTATLFLRRVRSFRGPRACVARAWVPLREILIGSTRWMWRSAF